MGARTLTTSLQHSLTGCGGRPADEEFQAPGMAPRPPPTLAPAPVAPEEEEKVGDACRGVGAGVDGGVGGGDGDRDGRWSGPMAPAVAPL
jgi:hypothetical protein